MSKNNHVVIIRFHYERNDPRFEWRFQYFKDNVLPRLLYQTVDDFDIAIRCNPWHNELFKNLHPRIIPFQVGNEHVDYKEVGRFKFFFDFSPWKNVIGLDKYLIQTGLDSDDLIVADYIETIRNEIKKYPPNESLHISFVPEIFNVAKCTTYGIGVKYSPTDGSAFMTLYQPRYNDPKYEYHFVYERSHHKLYKIVDRSITMPTGYCFASVHNWNESTGK